MNKLEHNFLKKQIKRIPRGGVVVEIGSWVGGSAYTMVKTSRKIGNPIKFFFIDPWRYGPGECPEELVSIAEGRDIRGEFDKRMIAFRGKYKTIESESVPASSRFLNGSIDMVFIDADHSYEAVKADIEAWYPKVKPGGIICGHDFGNKKYGVTEAVMEFFGDRFENKYRSMWKVIKN